MRPRRSTATAVPPYITSLQHHPGDPVPCHFHLVGVLAGRVLAVWTDCDHPGAEQAVYENKGPASVYGRRPVCCHDTCYCMRELSWLYAVDQKLAGLGDEDGYLEDGWKVCG